MKNKIEFLLLLFFYYISRLIGVNLSSYLGGILAWFYVERTLSKGKFHRLGKNVLKKNNVLVLEFNKFGILENKVFLNKEDRKKLAFSKDMTTNEISQKSFIAKFLSSIREKMYSNR